MKPRRDKDHLSFVKSLPCSVRICCAVHIDPAHTGGHGMSQKSPDTSCVPLCRRHHQEYDSHPRAFESKYNLSMAAIAQRLTQKPTIRIEGGMFVAYLEQERYVIGEISLSPKEIWKRVKMYFRQWWRETLIHERRTNIRLVPSCSTGTERAASSGEEVRS